jgi:hypothetical protein
VITMPDMVYVTVSADLPIRSTVQPYAARIELRFGKAYPVTLGIDRDALDRLAELIEAGRTELDAAAAELNKRGKRTQR